MPFLEKKISQLSFCLQPNFRFKRVTDYFFLTGNF